MHATTKLKFSRNNLLLVGMFHSTMLSVPQSVANGVCISRRKTVICFCINTSVKFYDDFANSYKAKSPSKANCSWKLRRSHKILQITEWQWIIAKGSAQWRVRSLQTGSSISLLHFPFRHGQCFVRFVSAVCGYKREQKTWHEGYVVVSPAAPNKVLSLLSHLYTYSCHPFRVFQC